jgi:hypothetical protein
MTPHDCIQRENVAMLKVQVEQLEECMGNIKNNHLRTIEDKLHEIDKKFDVLSLKFGFITGGAALAGGVIVSLITKYLGG